MTGLSKIITFLTSYTRVFSLFNKRYYHPVCPKKIGHRGAAGYCPENTFASFDKAVEIGADYLEIDVQMTKDGRIVVIHDPTVNRTTNGKGKVKEFTFKELQELDAGSWFHARFAGEKIPAFENVLDRYAEKIGLLIELKNPADFPGIEKKIAGELARRWLHHNKNDKIIVQSFDRLSMQKFHQILPAIPVGVLVKYRPHGITKKEIRDISQYAAYLNPKITMVNRKLIERIHDSGMKVIAWTVRSRAEANRLKGLPLDGVAADFLDYL